MMRNLKLLIVGLLLAIPGLAAAGGGDIPGAATWYFHVDLKKMRSDKAGKSIYGWMDEEIFAEIEAEIGVDIGEELDRVTAYSLQGQGQVLLFEGNITQKTRDVLMALIAAEGNLQAQRSSGKVYYRLAGDDSKASKSIASVRGGNIEVQIEALAEESWISMALKNKLIVTASEAQMKAMLDNGGRIRGKRAHNGALLVLTAEKTLLQAGMNSSVLGAEDDGESDWNSNILRNTKEVAFLLAAAADQLTIEVQLVTTEPEMARSLASVVRGLISLVSFDDEMDAEIIAVLQGTKVEANGSKLTLSLTVDPGLLVASLSE